MRNGKVYISLAAATAMGAYLVYKACTSGSDDSPPTSAAASASADEKPATEKPAPRVMASEPAPTTEPVAPRSTETSTEAPTEIATFVEDEAHEEADDDEALLELPSIGAAAAFVCENENEAAVLRNTAGSSAITPQASPAAKNDDWASAIAMTSALAAEGSSACASARASETTRASSDSDSGLALDALAVEYMNKVLAWPGLSDSEQVEAGAILHKLHLSNNGLPFSVLQDPMDIVAVVCRSVQRLGDSTTGSTKVLRKKNKEKTPGRRRRRSPGALGPSDTTRAALEDPPRPLLSSSMAWHATTPSIG